MKKCLILLFTGVALALSPGCDSQPPPAGEPVKIDNKDIKNAALAVNNFAFDLYTALKEKQGNLLFSPASIEAALAMTYAGARGGTAEEMKTVLRLALNNEKLHPAMGRLTELLSRKREGCSISFINSLWAQKGYSFSKEFLTTNKDNYSAGLIEVDFKNATEQARETINTWVEEKTNKKINDIIGPGVLGKLTTLVLANAIHFTGTWEKQFEPGNTQKGTFHLSKEKSVKVSMMRMSGEKFNYMEEKEFRAIEIPYTGGNISMIIFLPYMFDGLAALEKNLTTKNLQERLDRMKPRKITLLSIPRFTMTCDLNLADTLGQMGMPGAFSLETADFSGMAATKELFISHVLHKALVEINERGTEAAAATAVVMPRNGGTTFFANRPFLFLIRDRQTGAILFIGRLTDPSS